MVFTSLTPYILSCHHLDCVSSYFNLQVGL
ncbi:hypothetical protein ES332_D05G284800v1 [Gossypium tomentosum]|uniref:Uncharacterized protein n=1 Tax=Gossypium tomentosum TaxID=34277 RepID=A0A5D2L474_GOSTO|nr:hypothetical protein ES332_D05G284800v1 [Gossypium tomentosum]